MENSGILLVDDEIAYHGIMRTLFSTAGRPLLCVSNAGAAMEAIAGSAFALILMDIEMPDVDGFAATAMIRAQGGWAATCPIIAFTSLHPDDGERHFLKRGMDGYLPKPFGMADIAAAMRRWTGSDQELRTVDAPGQRLATLLGAEDARHMIDRFHDAMRDAVAAIDAGGHISGFGHRIGGLAGTLGFATLSSAWLALQDGDGGAWPTVRALTYEAITRHAGGDSAGHIGEFGG